MSGATFRLSDAPFADRAWGTVLGTIAAGGILVGLAKPRTFAVTLPILIVALLVFAWRRWGREALSGSLTSPVALAAAAFFSWSAVSILWSAAPMGSLVKTAAAAAMVFGCLAAIAAVQREPDADALRLGEGVWMAVLAAAVYLMFELWSGQALERGVLNLIGFKPGQLAPHYLYSWEGNRVVAILTLGLNRHLVGLVLLAMAGILAARATLARPWANAVTAAIALLGVASVFRGESETAKLAVFVVGLTWALCLLSQRWALNLVAVAWFAACLLIVPGLHAAHVTGLDQSPWLLKKLERGSAADRFSILNSFMRRVAERPLIGHGTNAAYAIGAREKEEAVRRTGDPEAEGTLAQHPHNAYLQIWFDLGLIGALLFTAFGLAVLGGIRRLEPQVRPYALATFTSAAAILAPSYGLWQFWYMAMFGTAALAMAMAIRAARVKPSAGSEPVAASSN